MPNIEASINTLCSYKAIKKPKLLRSIDLIFKIEHGLRIAQMILCPVEKAEIIEVEELTETLRGKGGFGSTGLK